MFPAVRSTHIREAFLSEALLSVGVLSLRIPLVLPREPRRGGFSFPLAVFLIHFTGLAHIHITHPLSFPPFAETWEAKFEKVIFFFPTMLFSILYSSY